MGLVCNQYQWFLTHVRQFAADTLGKSTQIESSIVAWCTMKTPYDVLGISPDADEKTIAIAFREAAKRCHPDLNPGDRVPTQDLATLEEDVQERERAPPASKQQRLNSCCERLENRSERVLKVRGPSAHYGAATRQSSGRNHNRRKSQVVRKQMHAAR